MITIIYGNCVHHFAIRTHVIICEIWSFNGIDISAVKAATIGVLFLKGHYAVCSHCSTALRSGQVRSVCLTCTFRASCCSARLSRAQVPLSGTGENSGERVYKGLRAVRPESVAGGGWFEVLWNLECPVELNQKRNMCAFQWRKFGRSAKK